MDEFVNHESFLNSLDFTVQDLVSKELSACVMEEKPFSLSLEQCLHYLEPREPTTNFIIEGGDAS